MSGELTEEQQKILDIRYKQLEEIRGVMADKKVLTRGQLEAKYENFSEKYPKTWVSIIDDTIKLGHLERNIEAYEQMFRKSRGKTYQERKFNADLKFGEKLAEEYLYPTTGRPDRDSYNKALTETRRKIQNSNLPTTSVPDKSKALRLEFDK